MTSKASHHQAKRAHLEQATKVDAGLKQMQ
jgi:hypothetical protein